MVGLSGAFLQCKKLVLILCATAWYSTATNAIHWDTNLRQYVDGQGRVRIFHGMNVVYKQDPWLPPTENFTNQTSLAAKDMDLLRSWGFNAVRLGVMWPGVEPKHNEISQAYLQQAAKIVDELGNRGIYTIVDLHQDIGSRRFCGEGFPEYYVDELLGDNGSLVATAKPFPAPKENPAVNSSGFPSLEDCLKTPFQDYYATYQVGALWRSLYETGSALNSGFLRFWSAVATEFKNVDHVLGYDLLNEPSGWCITGSCRSIPDLGNTVEKEFLMPLYQAAAAQIRQVDPNHILFYEPTVYPKLKQLLTGGHAFPEAVLGNDTQQGLAYHVYCQPNDGAGIMAGIECKLAQDIFTNEFYSFLGKYPVAGFMTEFGAIGDSKGELNHLNRLMGFADDQFFSWTYWMLKSYHDFTTSNKAEPLYGPDGQVEMQKLRTLSRTYAQAVQGMPMRMRFDPANADFEFDFKASNATGPTEIYLNEDLHYPNGYSVSVSPEGCITPDSKHERNFLRLHVYLVSCIGQVISIRIVAKPTAEGVEVVV